MVNYAVSLNVMLTDEVMRESVMPSELALDIQVKHSQGGHHTAG